MNRRDLMKLFGVGAVVAPVINGLANNVGAQARIIEPAKVEIIEPSEIIVTDQMPTGKILKIHVDILSDDGTRHHMDCISLSHSIEWYGNVEHRHRRITMELQGEDLPKIVHSSGQVRMVRQ